MDFSRKFRDAQGREWTVSITLANDDRVEEACGTSVINLVPAQTKKKPSNDSLQPLAELLADTYQVFAVVWALIESDANARGVDKASFKSALDADATHAMGLALLRALHDFFPNDPARQGILRQIAKILPEVAAATAKKIENELAKIDLKKLMDALPSLDGEKMTDAAIEQLKNGAGNSPATSE